jgi:hypothetical protein
MMAIVFGIFSKGIWVFTECAVLRLVPSFWKEIRKEGCKEIHKERK